MTQPSAFWAGSLAASIAWFLAHGDRKALERSLDEYVKRGASDDVRHHLRAIWKGK